MDAGSKSRLPAIPDAQQLAERRQALAERRDQETQALQAPPVHRVWVWLGFCGLAVIVLLVGALVYVVVQALRLAHENTVLSHKLADALAAQADRPVADYTGGFLVLGAIIALIALMKLMGK